MKKRKDERGIAHILAIIIVVVLVLVGAAGYYVWDKQKNKDTAGSNAVTSAAVAAACKTVDKDVCKFMSNWKANAYFTISATQTSSGTTTTMTMQMQGDNYRMVASGGSAFEMIKIGSITYIRDASDNTWWKQTDASASTSATTVEQDMNLTFKESAESTPAAQRVVYRKVATEACGTRTCLKYQVLDPAEASTTTYLWFDNHDYQLRRVQTTDAEGSYDMAFTYDKFTLTAPSPTKDMTSGVDSSIYSSMFPSSSAE
jgi:outer membrane lipoprotein-sorting protein